MNDTPKKSDYESKELYLKEALRLSESQMEQQSKTFEKIERKATLLVTLYIATIAYLLSWDLWDKTNGAITISLMVIFIILATATWIGSFVLLTRPFGVPGANPDYLVQEYFNYDFNKMAINLLEDYNKRFNLNETALSEKRTYLKISLWLGGACIIFACFWIIANLGIILLKIPLNDLFLFGTTRNAGF